MRVTRDGLCSSEGDLCARCVKDITECVFKKALSNYHSGGDIPLSLRLTGCPEYSMVHDVNDEISWGSF